MFFRAKDFSAAKKVITAMFNLSSFDERPWWRIKYYLVYDFSAHSKAYGGLFLLIILCTILPNSMQIWQKLSDFSMYSRINSIRPKILRLVSVGLALISVILLAKIIVVPYTEFIYFNF